VSLRFAGFLHGGGASFALGDFHLAFFLAGLITLLSVLGYVGLARDAGASIAQRK
jgi:hypothetical protein